MITKQKLDSWYEPKKLGAKSQWHAYMSRIRKTWRDKGYTTVLYDRSYFSYSTRERKNIRENVQRLSAMNKVVRIEKRVAESMMDYPFSFRTK